MHPDPKKRIRYRVDKKIMGKVPFLCASLPHKFIVLHIGEFIMGINQIQEIYDEGL